MDGADTDVYVWATRESGSIPRLCEELRCWSECECYGACAAMSMECACLGEELRSAYVIAVGGDDTGGGRRISVLIAPLSVKNIEGVCFALGAVCAKHGRGCGLSEAAFSRAVGSDENCGVCVRQDAFDGVEPQPLAPWWIGLTDGADVGLDECDGWLVCSH
jgi:hypothetical protein